MWREAGITGDELGNGMETVWAILTHLHEIRFGAKIELPDYDGKDVTKIIQAAQTAGVLSYSCVISD